MKFLKTITATATALALVTTSAMAMAITSMPDSAEARHRCSARTPWECVPHFDDIPNLQFTRFYLKNDSPYHIRVEVEYVSMSTNTWKTGYWDLAPGQKAYLLDITNPWVAVTAKSYGGSVKWNRHDVYTGTVFNNFTHRLIYRN